MKQKTSGKEEIRKKRHFDRVNDHEMGDIEMDR